MPKLMENAFTFVSHGLSPDTFTVVRFSGEEGMSLLYRFEILLISEQEDIDLTQVLQNPATFTIRGQFSNGPELPFHGILCGFEQLHQSDKYVFYRAELRPKLWWLTLTHHNQVFLDQSMDRFLSDLLRDGGLFPDLDFEFRFQSRYPVWEYLCQYGESHFDFFSRWMEHSGAYWWFEQGEEREKLIVSDTAIAHIPLPGHETVFYSPPSGLDAVMAGEVVKSFSLKQSPLPGTVLLKDYNYRKPFLELKSQAPVQERGRGEIYLYGEHFLDKAEGDRLAKVRAEEYRCREKVFHAESIIPAIRPGYRFTLNRHYRKDFNQDYLTLSVHHEGSQERYLIGGLGITGLSGKDELFYRNTFECIPADTQFRPRCITPKPRISGTISATVDAAGSGNYAELDDHGRYKVRLPFDLSDRSGGKASAWFRMATPYAGDGHGMHFPLLKGTEVLLTFIDGDPDRPIIAHAVPNYEKQSVVGDDNSRANAIKSARGNQIVLGDKEGQECISLMSKFHNSGMVVGSHKPGGGGSIAFATEGDWAKFVFGASNEAIVGTKNSFVGGSINEICAGFKTEFSAGMGLSAVLGSQIDYRYGPTIELGDEAISMRDESVIVGMNAIRMVSGLGKLDKAMIQTAKKLLVTGIVANIAAAVGGTLASTSLKNKDEKPNEDVEWSHPLEGGLGTALFAAGLGVSTVVAFKIRQLAEKFKKTLDDNAHTAEIVCDAKGLQLLVDSSVNSDTGTLFLAEVKESKNATNKQKSSIMITKSGSNIILNNKNNAGIVLLDGSRIKLLVKRDDSVDTEVIISDLIKISKTSGGKVLVDNNGILLTVSKPSAPVITLTENEAKIEAGTEKITLDKNAHTIKLETQQVAIEGDSVVKINGGIIKLG